MTTPSGLKIDPRPPRCIKTHYEIRCIKNGRATPLHDAAETLNEARERAAYKTRALALTEYFEADPAEFAAASQDGVYIVACQTETMATPI